MILTEFIIGFMVKVAASFDDTLTRIPVIASLTRTRRGKVAFSIGTVLSLTVALTVAIIFSEVIEGIAGIRYIIAGLIVILSIAVYSGMFTVHRTKQTIQEVNQIKRISHGRFAELVGIGFIVSFLTVIDDTIVITPLFLDKDAVVRIALAAGIYTATLLQVLAAIYFAERVAHMRYKREVAALSLVVLAVLIAFGII